MSRSFVLLTLFFFGFSLVAAQRFVSNERDVPIPDHQSKYQPLLVSIPVSNLPHRIDARFGLEKLQLAIRHPHISDIKVELYSPDGTMVWVTNRHGRDGANYIETIFTQNGFRGPISAGSPPFLGEYIPDGRLATLNNGQNPNGIWTLAVYDLKEKDTGVFNSVVLSFGNQPAQETVPRCSPSQPQGCQSPPKTGRLLPDLTLIPSVTYKEHHEVPFDEKTGWGGLRLGVSTMNIGYGPLEVFGSGVWKCGKNVVKDAQTICENGLYPRQQIFQNIYRLSKKKKNFVIEKRPAGTNAYDARPGHEHFHADDFVRYALLKKTSDPNPLKWKVIGEGIKASFCIWDLGFCREDLQNCEDEAGKVFASNNMPNYGLAGYNQCEGRLQGLSVGGVDYYGEHFEGQTILLPRGTQNGEYYLYVKVDPYNLYKESNEKNNELLIPITLRLQQF